MLNRWRRAQVASGGWYEIYAPTGAGRPHVG